MKKYHGVDTLEILEGAKNYNTWIAEKLNPWLKAPLLEVGSGTGNITSFFTSFQPFYASDIDPSLVALLEKKFSTSKNTQVIKLNIENAPKKYKGYFNSLIAINVLEHIEDDVHALRNIHELLSPHGRTILLVPAKKFAYTTLDKHLGHFRRYEKSELIEKLHTANFQIEKIEFFNFVGLASWIIRNKIDRDNKRLRPSHIRLFDMVVPILKVIESYFSPPLGISLIVVARKK